MIPGDSSKPSDNQKKQETPRKLFKLQETSRYSLETPGNLFKLQHTPETFWKILEDNWKVKETPGNLQKTMLVMCADKSYCQAQPKPASQPTAAG